MSRWAEAFHATSASADARRPDTAETMDTTQPFTTPEGFVSVCVSSVTPGGVPACCGTDLLDSYQRAALARPPSWAKPAAIPSPGCFCRCCELGRWWCEIVAPKGWRCWTCHPPDGMPADQVREVRT